MRATQFTAVHGEFRDLFGVDEVGLLHGVDLDEGYGLFVDGKDFGSLADVEFDLADIELGIDVEGDGEFRTS